MEKYLIVTDTTSAMDQEIAQKNGIELISLSVIVDGHEYKDQIDISTKQLYDYLRDGKIPSTSQPNTGYLVEQMEKWQEEDYEAIIIITCSADLSGTNNLLWIWLFVQNNLQMKEKLLMKFLLL